MAVAAQQAVVAQTQESFAAAGRLHPNFASPAPLPAPVARPAITHSRTRTRSFADADADMEDTARRLRPRTEDSPSRDDSPIRVDSVSTSASLSPSAVHSFLSEPLTFSCSSLPLSFPLLPLIFVRFCSGFFLFLVLVLLLSMSLPSALALPRSVSGRHSEYGRRRVFSVTVAYYTVGTKELANRISGLDSSQLKDPQLNKLW
jgi:hypothetical protein